MCLVRVSDHGASAMDMMKMGITGPRGGIKLTPLAFRACVLTIASPRFPDVTILPRPTFDADPCMRGQCNRFRFTVWLN